MGIYSRHFDVTELALRARLQERFPKGTRNFRVSRAKSHSQTKGEDRSCPFPIDFMLLQFFLFPLNDTKLIIKLLICKIVLFEVSGASLQSND
jgi:hypothetical protein